MGDFALELPLLPLKTRFSKGIGIVTGSLHAAEQSLLRSVDAQRIFDVTAPSDEVMVRSRPKSRIRREVCSRRSVRNQRSRAPTRDSLNRALCRESWAKRNGKGRHP